MQLGLMKMQALPEIARSLPLIQVLTSSWAKDFAPASFLMTKFLIHLRSSAQHAYLE
jgi:hypothetical protein